MPRNHLKRFADLENLPNVFLGLEGAKTFKAYEFFGNDNPITLELACGKGEYTVELARRFPDRNFIGIERKGNRLWKGARTALDEGLANAAFFRLDVELIGEIFRKDHIREIWITFPDPYPKTKQAKKRMTGPGYLRMYRKILRNEGLVHLKTDDDLLFESTLKSVAEENWMVVNRVNDIYEEAPADEILTIKTQYEKRFLESDLRIRYLCFRPGG
jgi:tRNA (guanine-N7-)-methyltransferase